MREEKRKIKKGKIIAVAIALVVIVIAVVLVVKFVNKDTEDGKKGQAGQQQQKEEAVVYDLPDITYSEMQVTDIEMKYLADNNETMISMMINNTTGNKVENESLTAYFIDSNGETIGSTRTYIASLEPGGQYSITIILKGNLTTTAQIKLQK